MNLARMRHVGRQLKLALALPCCFATLALVALLCSPAELSAACTTVNPNPNPNKASFDLVGDFNGDCRSDLLWRNSSSQQVYEWFMNGITNTGGGAPGSPTSDWVIQGTGDFDGDGKADILWR
ncbi:MAG: VCBS repeat-containing protein, partial [Acidobacteriaceae bacterium]